MNEGIVYIGTHIVTAVLLIIFLAACVLSFYYLIKTERMQKPLTLDLQYLGRLLDQATQEENIAAQNTTPNSSNKIQVGQVIINCSAQEYVNATQAERASFAAILNKHSK